MAMPLPHFSNPIPPHNNGYYDNIDILVKEMLKQLDITDDDLHKMTDYQLRAKIREVKLLTILNR